MAWVPVVGKLKEALNRGNWAAAEIQVTVLSRMDHPRDIFQNLTINGEPALQHLAHYIPSGIDVDKMNKVIKALTDSGYDINQKADLESFPSWASHKLTALLAAIAGRNFDLVQSLLRHGAQTDIRDARGYSPLHWAIFGGCRNIFDLLLDYGASVTSSEGERNGEEGKAHPLLHTAVDNGCPEMVAHLLRKNIFEVNEKAVYRDDDVDSGKVETYSPLGRAILQRDGVKIFWNLLHKPGIRVELDDLHLLFVHGDSKMAFFLLPHLSDFSNVNSRISSPASVWLSLGGENFEEVEKVILAMYTLLHLASIQRSKEVIQALVKEGGADVNCKTEGDVDLTPLQILMLRKQWDMAAFLIDEGAGLRVEGRFGAFPFAKVARKNMESGKLEVHSSLNAVELLLRMGDNGGLPVLDKVIARNDMEWMGANEFHLALEGGNPDMITRVLQKCSKMISKEDLSWLTVSSGEGAVQERVPSLLWLLHNICSGLSLPDNNEPAEEFLAALATLVRLFVEKGYDVSLTWKSTQEAPPVPPETLLHYALQIDMIGRTNVLLQTLVQLEHLQGVVPVTTGEGRKCLEYLLHAWSDCCQENEGTKCWENGPTGERVTFCVDAVKMLMTYGLNVRQVVIREEFKYHFGYKSMIQLLYRNGVQIEDSYFSPETVCSTGHPIAREMERELSELKEWKEKFDQDNPTISLKNICRLRVRETLTGSEQLEMLEGLPVVLKEFVLKNDIV